MKRTKLEFTMLIVTMLVIFSCSEDSTSSDTEAPTVAITYPINNLEVVQGTVITISADATDNEEVEKVEFYIDGSIVETDYNSPYNIEWDTTDLSGNRIIYARAYDTSDNNSTSEEITVTLINGISGIVTDIDGNVYQTIIIGNQEWMMENLKVTHYRNGDPISAGYNNSEWVNLLTGAFCIYDDDPSNVETYGALYNWYAVDDPRGIAPAGWHVSTDAEIMELEMYLGMSESDANSIGWRGTNEGSKLASRADLWINGGYLVNNAEFGTSGFCALPGGFRGVDLGYFNNMAFKGYFWSSTEYSSSHAWVRDLDCGYSEVRRGYARKKHGFSVRCVRD